MSRALRRDAAVAGIGFAVALLLALHWMRPGAVVLEARWIADPLNAIAKQLFAWNTYASAGGAPSAAYTAWPYALTLGALCAAFGRSAGQMLALGFALGLGWAGIFCALRLARSTPVAAALGASVYAVNPWTAQWLPASPSYAWCFACGPAIAALAIAGARVPARRAALRAALIGVAAVPAALAAGDAVAMLVLGCFFVAGASIGAMGGERAGFARWTFATALWCLAAAVWWIVPSFYPGAAGLWAAIEPGSLALLALAAAGSALAYATDRALAWRRPAGIALVALVAAVLAVSGRALLGTPFAEGTAIAPPAYAKIPAYWYDAAAWLNARPGEDAVLALPPDPAGGPADYAWGGRAPDRLPNDLFARRSVLIGSHSEAASDEDAAISGLFARALARDGDDLTALLHLWGIRYVLFRGDFVQSGPSGVLSLDDVRRRLPHAATASFGPLTLFDTGPAGASVQRRAQWIAGDYEQTASGLLLSSQLEDVVRIGVDQLARNVPAQPAAAYEVSAYLSDSRFPGGELARTALAGAPLRYLWSSPLWWAPLHQFSLSLTGHSPVQAVVRRDALPADRTGLTLGASMLQAASAGDARPFLSTIYSSSTPHHIDWQVVNPSDRNVLADVSVAVNAPTPTAYTLSVNGRTYAAALAAQSANVWATFTGVALQPGINVLAMDSAPASSGLAGAAQSDAALGTIRAIVRSTQAANPASVTHLRYGSVPLGVTLNRDPILTFSYDAPALPVRLGVLLHVAVANLEFRCFAPIGTDSPLDLAVAAGACMQMAGIAPTSTLLSSARLLDVDLDALLPPQTLPAAATPHIKGVLLTWLQSGIDADPLPGLQISTEGLASTVVPTAFRYGAFLGRARARPPGDIAGAQVFIAQTDREIAGIVVGENARTYTVLEANGTIDTVVKRKIVALRTFPTRGTLTLAFDPRAVAPGGTIGISASGFPIFGAWLGHFEGSPGRFVPDDYLEWIFAGNSTNEFQARASDIERAALSGRAAIRFGFYRPDRPDIYAFNVLARVTPAHPVGVDVTIGDHRIAAAEGRFSVPPSPQGLTRVRIDDAADQTLFGAVGAPVAADAPEHLAPSGLLPIAGALAAGKLVRLEQTYSDSWFAVCLGHCSLVPPHFRDQSGWNVWSLDGGGTLLLGNWFAIGQVLSGLASLTAVLLSLRGARGARAA